MGKHTETMADMHLSRSEYLGFMRKEQPFRELERKAKKSERHKGKIWTQEQLDLHVAQCVCLLSKMVLPDSAL